MSPQRTIPQSRGSDPSPARGTPHSPGAAVCWSWAQALRFPPSPLQELVELQQIYLPRGTPLTATSRVLEPKRGPPEEWTEGGEKEISRQRRSPAPRVSPRSVSSQPFRPAHLRRGRRTYIRQRSEAIIDSVCYAVRARKCPTLKHFRVQDGRPNYLVRLPPSFSIPLRFFNLDVTS